MCFVCEFVFYCVWLLCVFLVSVLFVIYWFLNATVLASIVAFQNRTAHAQKKTKQKQT